MRRIGAAVFVVCLPFAARAGHDKVRANSYDDTWRASWVSHCQDVYTTSGKTDGFVLQVGDSITWSRAYSGWAVNSSGKTAEDTTICSWIMAVGNWGSGETDTSNKNGFYLGGADTTGQRSMTAASGIDTAQFLSGFDNGGPLMPLETSSQSAAQTVVSDATYIGNIRIETLIAAFQDAQFAVLMLGTNDVGGRSTTDFINNLTSIIDKLEAQSIVVVVSTIPPYVGKQTEVQSYNTEIRALAQSKELPLIDYYAEMMARQPINWSTTLMAGDGYHPSGSGGVYTSGSDPYTPGGDPSTHTTGDACLNVGFLLRGWLTVQKLKEVKAEVVDGVGPVLTPPSVSLSADPTTILEGEQVDFTAFATDDGTIVRYEWDFDGDGTYEQDTGTTSTVTHTFTTPGTYSVKVRVTDDDDLAGVSNAVTIVVQADTDGDGMPDDWENRHSLNPNNASDATEDPDTDGLDNLAEYEAGTDPQDPDTDGDGVPDGQDGDPTHAPLPMTGCGGPAALALLALLAARRRKK